MAKKKVVKPDHIYMLLDKSASMSGRWSDTLGAVANFFKEQSEQPGECVVTFATFDSPGTHTEHVKAVAASDFEVPHVHANGYSTALLDATMLAIDDVKATRKDYEKVIFVVMTDGLENDSKEVKDSSVVAAAIDTLRKKDKVEVLYMGVGPDAWSNAPLYGPNTMMVGQTITASNTAVNVASVMTSSYRGQSNLDGEAIYNVSKVDDDGTVTKE